MNKGIMGIKVSIAIVGLSFAAATAHAGTTNSWRATGASGFWDATGSAWSLSAPPSITDVGDFVTNVNSKIITIDSAVVSDTPSSLTVSNVTIAGIGGATNTLFLNNASTVVPLEVISSMLISNAGVLQITNSFLKVDGGSGGMYTQFGSMRIFNGAKVQLNKATISTPAILQFALGTNANTVAVTTDLTLGGTLNIVNGGGFTNNSTYTLFTYGGALTYNGLTVGTTPNTNFTYTVDTSAAGLVKLTVSGGIITPPSTGTFQIVSIARSANDITVEWTAASAGTNAVQAANGGGNGYSTNNFTDISGSFFVSGGATNSFTDTGGATNAPSRFYRVRTVQ